MTKKDDKIINKLESIDYRSGKIRDNIEGTHLILVIGFIALFLVCLVGVHRLGKLIPEEDIEIAPPIEASIEGCVDGIRGEYTLILDKRRIIDRVCADDMKKIFPGDIVRITKSRGFLGCNIHRAEIISYSETDLSTCSKEVKTHAQ